MCLLDDSPLDLLWKSFENEKVSLEGLKAQTLVKYRPCLYALKAFRKLDITGYTPEILTAHLRDLAEQGRKPRTVDWHYAVLHSFFSWAKRRGHVAKHPFDGIKRRPAEPPLPRAVEWNEAMAAVENCWGRLYSQRDQAAALLMLLTGARTSEVLSRTVEDIDLERMTVTYTNTKGRQPRVIPIPRFAQAKLQHYLEWRASMYQKSPWLFPNPRGGELSPSTFSKRFRDYGNKIEPYVLRHTRLTDAARRVPLPVVAKMAGHRNVNTTMRYTKVSDEDLRRAAELVEEYVDERRDWRGKKIYGRLEGDRAAAD